LLLVQPGQSFASGVITGEMIPVVEDNRGNRTRAIPLQLP
jgi:hypothetical protein